MKNNYPIRYAVRPIVEQVGWCSGLNELEREDGEVAYIASKCYQIRHTTDYSQNGEVTESFNVVFPFQKDSISYDEYYRVTPNFNIYGESINSTVVSKVFKTYEEALVEAKLMNEKIVKKKIGSLVYNSNFGEAVAEIKEAQKDKLEEYRFLEEQTEEKTPDLVVDAPIKEQRIVIISDNKAKYSDSSLYEFIEYWYGQEFLVFNVSEYEFEEMKKAILEEKDFDYKSIEKNLLLEGVSTSDLVKIGDYNSKRDKGCFYIQNKLMSYDKDLDTPRSIDGDDEKIRVYTIEAYEDVINSYIANYIYNASIVMDEEAKVLEKGVIRKSDIRCNK